MDYCALSASEGSKQEAAGRRSLASVCLNSKESLDPGLQLRQSFKKRSPGHGSNPRGGGVVSTAGLRQTAV